MTHTILIGLLLFGIPLLVIIAIVYLVVRPRNGQHNALTTYQVLIGYFYFMISASIITMAVGTVYFARVAFSRVFNGGEISNDLTLGSVLLVTGLVICLLHIYGRHTVQKSEDKIITNIRQIHLFFMLGIFSLTGIATIPLAIYQTIHYFTAESAYHHPQTPSTGLAIATVSMLVWAYYSFRLLREINKRNRGEIEN